MKHSFDLRSRYFVIAALLVLIASSLFGCSGDDGATGPAGPPGKDATATVNAAELTIDQWAALSLKGEVTDVTIASAPVVKFKVTDNFGNPVVGLGFTSKSSTATLPGLTNLAFTIGKLVPGTNGSPSKWVSYIVTTVPTTTAPTVTGTRPTTDNTGTLVDNGDGTYQYTFYRDIAKVKDAVNATTDSGANLKADLGDLTYDPALTHRVVVQVGGYARGTGNNTPDGSTQVSEVRIGSPANLVYDFIPATGQKVSATDTSREIVLMSSCLECHSKFAVHGGNRQDPRFCVLCHTDQRKYGRTEAATTSTGYSGSTYRINNEAVGNFLPFIHRMHMGEALTKTGYNYADVLFNEVKYPQDIRNCVKCHKASTAAPQGDNWKNKPSRSACGACHDNVNFATGANHAGGPRADDSQCASCHTAAEIMAVHVPVTPINKNNIYSGGTNANTNAASIAAFTDNLPPGASIITYDLNSVTRNSNKNAVVKFKLKKDGTDVVFNAPGGEIMDNFVGSPSVYCAFSVPQDGIAAPADFNATASNYIKNVRNGTATGTGTGTIAGPDSSGYYTATLTGVLIPDSAKMLTCGVGYTYNLSSAQPLTQTNVPGYPYNTTTKVGGLIVVAPNIWKVASGYNGRRVIVDTAKCNNCHGKLGVFLEEAFHAGQRNDAPTCSFCHNPNRTSSGWSANASTFVHAIHGASKRTTPFGWAAADVDDGFWQIGYPGVLKNCEQCHLPNAFDFSSSTYTANNGAQGVSNMLYTTVGTGTYTAGALGLSPYVTPGTNYGSGFSFAGATGTTTEAAGTTLVNSPITAACFSCHDSSIAMAHMRENGGSIYAPRASALATPEQCLICHGTGRVADIQAVHVGRDTVIHQ